MWTLLRSTATTKYVFHCHQPSIKKRTCQETEVCFNRAKRSRLSVAIGKISIHFVCFYFSRLVSCRNNVWFQKKSVRTQGWSLEIPRGKGFSKAKIFKGKYETKLEIPRGWEGPNQKNIPGGGMDIFWNHTIIEVGLTWKYWLAYAFSVLSLNTERFFIRPEAVFNISLKSLTSRKKWNFFRTGGWLIQQQRGERAKKTLWSRQLWTSLPWAQILNSVADWFSYLAQGGFLQ